MELDELLITTGVDALVRLVKEKQRIEISAAARQLNLDESTMEEWSRILEEEGILRMEYRLTRVYLEWIKPSEEKIAEEKEAFYQKKAGLGKEVEKARSELRTEAGELHRLREGFAEVYAKLAPRLDLLEKATGRMGAGPAMPPELEEARARIASLSGEIQGLRREWGDLEKRVKISAPVPGEDRTIRIKGWVGSLEELQKRAKKMEAGIPAELPLGRELEKKVDALRKEFQEIQKKENKMREDLRSVSEAGEIISEMKGHLEQHEQTVGSMRNELGSLQEQLRNVQEQAQSFGKKVREEMEAIDRFTDSVTVAKSILARYPSQQRVLQELELMQERERSILEKMQAVEKILSALGSPQQILDEFQALEEKAEEEKKALQEEAENATQAIQEYKSLFQTFEKIRERTMQSIDSYTKELVGLQKQMERAAEQSKTAQSQWEKEAKVWTQRMKEKEMQETLRAIEGLRGKKQLLDDVQVRMEDLNIRTETLMRRMNLLGQQARLLEIRTGTAPAGEQERKMDEIQNQFALTQQEQEEFRKKREELKELIKKLWEES